MGCSVSSHISEITPEELTELCSHVCYVCHEMCVTHSQCQCKKHIHQSCMNLLPMKNSKRCTICNTMFYNHKVISPLNKDIHRLISYDPEPIERKRTLFYMACLLNILEIFNSSKTRSIEGGLSGVDSGADS